MCYGISGTIDDKGKVRCAFTCSHDEKANKPNEWRRKYWEWELHYPDLKKPVFTNEKEVGKCSLELKQKVVEWCKLNENKLKVAFGSDGDRQGPELFGKAKTGDLDFREAKTGDLYFGKAKTDYLSFEGAETGGLGFREAKTGNLCFWEAKTGGLSFWEAKTGDLGFRGAKTGDLYFWKAETGDLHFEEAKVGEVFIKNLQPESRWLSKKIREFSENNGWIDCTLTAFCRWLFEKQKREECE